MKTLLLTITLVALAAAYLHGQQRAGVHGFPITTTVTEGELRGVYDTKTGIQKYLGVPFASPPLGDLRWRAPQAPRPYSGVRTATDFGPRAMQKFIFDDMRFRSDGVSEDCLYLNVWTPANTGQKDLPILLYFHGGGNVAGSGDELRYDGEELAKQGVIVVTANYRMGVFGFLAHPKLAAEGDPAFANFGLLDQVAALKWIRDNAEAFGGNPDKITIGGESAGSMDCSVLMASPLSRGMVAGVLGQSGAVIAPLSAPIPPEKAAEMTEKFMQAVGVSSVAELRDAPAKLIYETAYEQPGHSFRIVLDDHLLPATLTQLYGDGAQAKVPLMVGWTSAEVAWTQAPSSAAAYEKELEEKYGSASDDLLRLYPATDLANSYTQLSSDVWIVYPTWRWADLHRRTGNAPVYRYRFDQIRPPLVGQDRARAPIGAGHATDIEYFLNTLNKSDAYAWTEEDREAAKSASTYLANFIKTGNPNGSDLPEWAPLTDTDATPTVMHLKAGPESKPSEVEDRHAFWRDYYNK